MKNFLKAMVNFFKKLFSSKDEEVTVDEPINEPIIEPINEPILEEPQFIDNTIILIDNGHGIDTAGKRSPYSLKGLEPALEFFEYEWNREIAADVVKELNNRGYNAILLVPELNDISLPERAKRVNNFCAEVGANNTILVSVHSNALGNGSKWENGKGWSAYTTKGKTKSDILAECLYEEAEKNFMGRKIRKDKSDGDSDWEENFTIIYMSKCPAVLTENFFYDNIDDLNYILSEEGKNAIIKTHVDGIINYLNSK